VASYYCLSFLLHFSVLLLLAADGSYFIYFASSLSLPKRVQAVEKQEFWSVLFFAESPALRGMPDTD
jgi:hypothetical protein